MKRSWMNWAALVAMALMLFAFGGCSDDDDGGTGNGNDPLDSVVLTTAGDAYFSTYKIDVDGDGTRETGVNTVPANIVANLDDYYIIDYRSSTDYDWAHIPGANNLALSALVDEIDNLPTDRVILNVCYTGQTASFATSIINILGTQTGHKAINLKFGMSYYAPLNLVKADGTFNYVTSDDYDALMTADVTPKAAAGDLPVVDTGESTDLDILKARAREATARWSSSHQYSVFASAADVVPLDTNNWYLINYFSDAAYANGHLPGAIQYNTSPSEFVSTAALNTLPTDKSIAIYCYTGQTSAQVVAYLAMLGYDAKTITYGVQKMCYNNATINTVQWHATTDMNPLVGDYTK